jgi:hypothetical protein
MMKMENNEIRNMRSDFERIKHLTEKGVESWTSRKLCSAMGKRYADSDYLQRAQGCLCRIS